MDIEVRVADDRNQVFLSMEAEDARILQILPAELPQLLFQRALTG
jgi:hypothetical protein